MDERSDAPWHSGSGGETTAVSGLDSLPSDTNFAQQWHLNNRTAGEFDLNLVDVWSSYSGKGVTAVLIDDGFDYNHPDLAPPNYDATRDYDFDEGGGLEPLRRHHRRRARHRRHRHPGHGPKRQRRGRRRA